MSARYEVARKKYGDIDIEIYYHPTHGVIVPRMIDAVERSFAYYEKHFGPYYHKQARILEFPRYSTFAQAFPGTMPYSESFGFITNLEDESENNVVDAVIAHEMAHQWWAHQEIPAQMQGGTMLTESFAEYSSLMVMKEELKDDMKMKNFLKYDFNRYLRGRTGELEKELPLYKVENQGYIHYGKGSVILYALQDYIGEDSVNTALSTFLDRYAYAEPPYPNTMDFLEFLEPCVPDTLQYLIQDWIKEITLYDFRLKEAVATKLPNGKYEVVFDLEARKLYADSLGNETEQPLKEWVDIGVYSDSDEEELTTWKRVNITESPARFSLITDSLPAKAAIDPRRMLIERVIDDNVKSVKES
jgi:aminopeptidase N